MRARVVAVVQARMTSTRFPGKVLADLGGRPALALLLARLREARELDGIVLATSTEPSDDPVAELAPHAGAQLVRGPLHDVLERFRLAAKASEPDAVARITGDSPFICPEVVDAVVARWRVTGEDLVTNSIEPRSFPSGLDVEVIARPALEVAAAEASEPIEREHVTPFLRRHPYRFSHARVDLDPPCPDARLDLDTPADLEDLRAVLARVGQQAGLEELLAATGCPPAGIRGTRT